PQQSVDAALTDLRALLALRAEHVSYYQLTLEPNTEFFKHPPLLPDDELAWLMQEQGFALLREHGYAQYEVSAHPRPAKRARHNLNYWEFGDYLGIGAGAHGKRTRDGVIHRRARRKQPSAYLETAGSREAIGEESVVDGADLPFEFAMNALRLNDGFALD